VTEPERKPGRRVRSSSPALNRLFASRDRHPWLAPAALLFCWLTALAFILPYDPDEAVYKIVAHGIVHGQWPYRDLFDHKPPLIYIWYLPAGLGATLELQRVIAAAVTAASVPFVARLARRSLTGRSVKVAPWAYCLLLGNPLLAVGANAEAFVLLPLLAAIATPSAWLAGALFGVAIMTKTSAAAFAPLMLFLWRRQSWQVVLTASTLCAVVSLPFAPIWRDYWNDAVTFNASYSSYANRDSISRLVLIEPSVLLGALPLWLAAIIGAFKLRSGAAWVCAACAILSVKATSYDFAHYYALLAAPAALLAAAGLEFPLAGTPRRAGLAALTVVALATSISGLYFAERSRHAYDGLTEVVSREAGEVYMLGDHSQVYEYVSRRPRRTWFFAVPLVVRPRWGEQARLDLLDCPPDVLIVSNDSLFQVAWTADLEALYANRVDFEPADVFTNPIKHCETY